MNFGTDHVCLEEHAAVKSYDKQNVPFTVEIQTATLGSGAAAFEYLWRT